MKIQCVEVIDCTHSDDWRTPANKDSQQQSTDGITAYAGFVEPTDEAVYVEPYRLKSSITGKTTTGQGKNN